MPENKGLPIFSTPSSPPSFLPNTPTQKNNGRDRLSSTNSRTDYQERNNKNGKTRTAARGPAAHSSTLCYENKVLILR